MQEIFEENQSKMFQGAIVWMPMLETDNHTAAKEGEIRYSDSRIKHYWDPDRILGRLLSRTLNLKASMAWDVYLVYPPEHAWDTEIPPTPKFWMHQLDEELALFLSPLRLKGAVQTMIERVKDE